MADLTEEGVEHSDLLASLVPCVAQLKDSYAILTEEYERRKKDMIGKWVWPVGVVNTCPL